MDFHEIYSGFRAHNRGSRVNLVVALIIGLIKFLIQLHDAHMERLILQT